MSLNFQLNRPPKQEDAQVDLSWDSVDGAASYHVKRSTTSGGPYTTVADDVYGTSYTDSDVVNGTTYYYVIAAVNTGGESGPSNEAPAIPEAPVVEPNRAILSIDLADGQEKEYDLPMGEIEDFIEWYEDSANGTASAVYAIEKPNASGPFVGGRIT